MTVLAGATWPEASRNALVLIPLGSTEQHGPHLPMATDAIIAEAVACAAAAGIWDQARRPVLVAPTMPYGASGEHQDFPGTLSIGHQGLQAFLVELIRSASAWAERIVLVNAHGGNEPTVSAIVRQMRGEGHDVIGAGCGLGAPTDAHAGHDETSLMLHLRPDLVRGELAQPGNPAPIEELMPRLRAEGVRAVAPSGVLGDPTRATAEAGKALLLEIVQRLVRQVGGSA